MIIGSTISHYRIAAKLGEGGMGVVYQAEDTKLERTVALKFLADHLLNDSEAKQRFLREAKAAAALHHPNVCPVHEIDEVDGKTFLAMALLEGASLEDRIAQGPLPIKDALDIARQIAEGLEAAHAKSIVHRDIKPANIIVSPEGRPTIMDFGLARLTEASRLTKVDTAMGTVAYMSPEQAQGMEVDSRTDIWALGCVLYEMVSGQRPFLGQYDQALLYEIVHEEPAPLTSIRTGVPMELEFIVNECLTKDRDDRTESAREVARKLRTLSDKLKSGRSTILHTSVAAPLTSRTLAPAAPLPRAKQRLTLALLGFVPLAFLALLAVHFSESSSETPARIVTRFSFAPDGFNEVNISPDGKYIAYTTGLGPQARLWVRSMSDESARELPGTEGAYWIFWAPDSSAIGFGTLTELKRIALDGTGLITLCDLPSPDRFSLLGGTWSPDNERIVFSSGLQLYEVAARGGQPKLLLASDDGPFPYFVTPHFLPTGRGPAALAFKAGRSPSNGVIVVLNLETGERKELGPGDRPAFSPPGYLVHGPENSAELGLAAWPFSLETLEATGEDFPISTAGRNSSFSRDGVMVYRDGAGSASWRTLVWRNRAGELIETIDKPQPGLSTPALSPDGQRVAVYSIESGNEDIWVYDLAASTKTRLTFDSTPERTPAWSPSGEQIAYSYQGAEGGSALRKVAADGSGQPVVLVESVNPFTNPYWSRDGRYMVYDEIVSETGPDIHYVRLGEDGKASQPIVFVATPAAEQASKLSPDGRFIAYMSDESGRSEIYVQAFPEGAGKRQVSSNGGTMPRWRSDGRELYFVQDNNALMAVSVSTAQGIVLGQPQKLFESADLATTYSTPTYDVSADGQRFIMATVAQDAAASPPAIRIVQNWYEEFRDRQK